MSVQMSFWLIFHVRSIFIRYVGYVCNNKKNTNRNLLFRKPDQKRMLKCDYWVTGGPLASEHRMLVPSVFWNLFWKSLNGKGDTIESAKIFKSHGCGTARYVNNRVFNICENRVYDACIRTRWFTSKPGFT